MDESKSNKTKENLAIFCEKPVSGKFIEQLLNTHYDITLLDIKKYNIHEKQQFFDHAIVLVDTIYMDSEISNNPNLGKELVEKLFENRQKIFVQNFDSIKKTWIFVDLCPEGNSFLSLKACLKQFHNYLDGVDNYFKKLGVEIRYFSIPDLNKNYISKQLLFNLPN